MLNDRLQGNFVGKNVVNLSRRNLTGSEISLLSKGLNFVPTSNTIDKAKLKNEENVFDLDQVKPKSTFNPSNKDVAIEVYMST